MRQLCKYLVVLSLLLTVSTHYAMDYGVDTSNVTKACGGGFGSGCGSCGPCGTTCGSCLGGGCCDSGCGGGCGCCCDFCLDCCQDCCCQASPCGYPFFAYRSTGINLARDNAGINPWINRDDMDATSGLLSFGVEYTKSFRPCRITQALFGCDVMGGNTLAIQGIAVQDRLPCAWLADYLGLSHAFDSRVTFCPRIENVIVNLDLYLGLDGIKEGMYFRVHSPLTWTKWNLNMCECIINTGIMNGQEIGFAPGYMAEKPIAPFNPAPGATVYHGLIAKSALPQSFTEAMSGWARWGDMKTPICYGRIAACGLKRTALADIHAILGWNLHKEDYHVGINARLIIPTGLKPNATFLFEPQIGDSKHWQLGIGLTKSRILWRNEENDDNYLAMYFDANILHMFKNCQCRSFDFCCKPNSRYMLLAEMGPNLDGLQWYNDGAGSVDATYQYQKNLIPAINYSTFNVEVKVAVQADLMLKASYVRNNWSCDVGYEFWARTGEKFCLPGCCGCNDTGCCGASCGCPSCGDCGYFGNCCSSACCNPCGSCNSCDGPCTNCGPCNPSMGLWGHRGSTGATVGGCSCSPCDKKWAIKGDSILYGSTEANNFFINSVPLAPSQALADIHGGMNRKEADINDGLRNKGIDNPKLASLQGPPVAALFSEPYTFAHAEGFVPPVGLGFADIYSSFQPRIIGMCDLNMCKSPSAITHKIFMHMNYAWKEREDNCTPFVGFGAEAEFASGCSSCSFAISQWGIWFKTGFAFE